MEEEAKVSKTGMMRNNGAKLPMDMVPPEAALLGAAIYGFGAAKYARDNWRKGGPWSEVIGCLERHLAWFKIGEDMDPDSGLCHLINMAFNVNTLLAFWGTGNGEDDRHKLTPEQLQRLHEQVDATAKAMKSGIDAYNAKKAAEADAAKVDPFTKNLQKVVELTKKAVTGDGGIIVTCDEKALALAEESEHIKRMNEARELLSNSDKFEVAIAKIRNSPPAYDEDPRAHLALLDHAKKAE